MDGNNNNQDNSNKQSRVLFVHNGDWAGIHARSMLTNKPSTIEETNLACPVGTVSKVQTTQIQNGFEGYDAIVVILTKGCFQPSFVTVVEKVIEQKLKMILLYEPTDFPFPNSSQVPTSISKILEKSTLRLLPDYVAECWRNIDHRIHYELPTPKYQIFVCNHFTGQGIATELTNQLSELQYSTFYDPKSEYDLHDLKKMIKNCQVFIVVISSGVFESIWCQKEFEYAVKHKKPILFTKDHAFDNLEQYDYADFEYLTYDPIYAKECAERLHRQIENMEAQRDDTPFFWPKKEKQLSVTKNFGGAVAHNPDVLIFGILVGIILCWLFA